MIRAIIKSVVEGVVKRFSATGLIGQDIDNREYLQHYGYTSRPLEGAEAIIIRDGNHIVMIASDDRRYRISLEAGEVALYTDEGDKIHLKRNRHIEIIGGEKITATTKVAEITATTSAAITSPVVTITAADSVTATTKVATINASEYCQVNSPQINLGGDRDGLRSIIDERLIALFNGHSHGGYLAGAIDARIVALFNDHRHVALDTPPTTQIDPSQCYTSAGAQGLNTGLTQANCCTTVTKVK